MSHICGDCGRAVARCEWCGESDALQDGSHNWPVTTQPGWDGNFHEPCYVSCRRALLPHGTAVASESSEPA